MKIYLYFFNLKKKSLGNALHGKEKLNYDFDMRERDRESMVINEIEKLKLTIYHV